MVGAMKSFSKKLWGHENRCWILFSGLQKYFWKTNRSPSYILNVHSLKKMFWKISQHFYRKTPLLELLFNKVLVFPASACNFTNSNTPPWMFFMFFELCKWYQIAQSFSYRFLSYSLWALLDDIMIGKVTLEVFLAISLKLIKLLNLTLETHENGVYGYTFVLCGTWIILICLRFPEK